LVFLAEAISHALTSAVTFINILSLENDDDLLDLHLFKPGAGGSFEVREKYTRLSGKLSVRLLQSMVVSNMVVQERVLAARQCSGVVWQLSSF
jgi:hypothetical protein